MKYTFESLSDAGRREFVQGLLSFDGIICDSGMTGGEVMVSYLGRQALSYTPPEMQSRVVSAFSHVQECGACRRAFTGIKRADTEIRLVP